MQFHHHGYVSGDPRIHAPAGTGLDRPEELPDEMDVLIVGSGPAGMVTAAQLSQFPDVSTRIIERRPGRLEIGQADGIQARSVETFQAFGFAERVIQEGYRITEMAFWKPDPEHPENIIRTARPIDDPSHVSEFPHLIVNQARILDYFREYMNIAPTRMDVDYGVEFLGLTVEESGEHPVAVRVRYTAGPREGEERTVHAKYVLGADGARSGVRDAIGRVMAGDEANHAWGVMDVLAVTDFPDIRTKCAIQSHDGGNILHIPREGGHLFRMYVDLGEVDEHDNHRVRATSLEEIVEQANKIIHPYTLEVRSVGWYSVYEVAHRLTDHFDDVEPAERGSRSPRVFIAGDACHTHSAKAGQGMNVSMQDAFNLGWKLGHVLEGRSPVRLLDTYSAERQVVAKDLIDFDKEWSTLMASRQEDLPDPTYLEDFYTRTAEFPAGFMTEYTQSMITGSTEHQGLATGFPVGKRFKSALATRVSDANPLEIGHEAQADGRWRIHVFADAAAAGDESPTTALGEWLEHSPESPIALTPAGRDANDWFDVKVVYQQDHTEVDITRVPRAFLPLVGPFSLVDYDNVFAATEGADIFDARGVSRDGAIVVVRPDQYVAQVLPLTATATLAAFFRGNLGGAGAAEG